MMMQACVVFIREASEPVVNRGALSCTQAVELLFKGSSSMM